MATLVFFITVLAIIFIMVQTVISLVRGRSIVHQLKILLSLITGYTVLWLFFFAVRKDEAVAFGTPICFDDWCATINSVTFVKSQQDSTFVILNIGMINNARGIAQMPSQPRVHLIDSSGKAWPYSPLRQNILQKQYGVQPGIAHRLELHQTLNTKLAFAISNRVKKLTALVEEGPWITYLIFPQGRQVFALN